MDILLRKDYKTEVVPATESVGLYLAQDAIVEWVESFVDEDTAETVNINRTDVVVPRGRMITPRMVEMMTECGVKQVTVANVAFRAQEWTLFSHLANVKVTVRNNLGDTAVLIVRSDSLRGAQDLAADYAEGAVNCIFKTQCADHVYITKSEIIEGIHFIGRTKADIKEEEENLEKKTALCVKIETLAYETAKTYAQWDELTKQVIAWQNEWKSIGFTPRKVNNEIFERFRIACDRFFQAKTACFKEMRETLAANLAAKNALVEQAEALKDSTDWGATTNKLVELQKEWKNIGPVAHKVSDSVWKRFNNACNAFFDRKNEANKGQRKEEEANLELKNAVIAELEKLVAEPTDNLLQAVRDLQARWGEIGHVPFRKKEKIYRRYRELCDKIYDSLHESAGRRRMDSFRKNVAEKGGTELTRERTRLQNAFDAKKQEIQTYETNLSFFRTSSKKGNSLMADIEKKVERLKEDLEMLTQKIKEVNKQIQAEAENK